MNFFFPCQMSENISLCETRFSVSNLGIFVSDPVGNILRIQYFFGKFIVSWNFVTTQTGLWYHVFLVFFLLLVVLCYVPQNYFDNVSQRVRLLKGLVKMACDFHQIFTLLFIWILQYCRIMLYAGMLLSYIFLFFPIFSYYSQKSYIFL